MLHGVSRRVMWNMCVFRVLPQEWTERVRFCFPQQVWSLTLGHWLVTRSDIKATQRDTGAVLHWWWWHKCQHWKRTNSWLNITEQQFARSRSTQKHALSKQNLECNSSSSQTEPLKLETMIRSAPDAFVVNQLGVLAKCFEIGKRYKWAGAVWYNCLKISPTPKQ